MRSNLFFIMPNPVYRALTAALAIVLLTAEAWSDNEPLRPVQTFAAADQAVRIEVSPRRALDQLGVVLLDASGEEIRPIREVQRGEVDLRSIYPDLDELRRPAYLQLIEFGDPSGPAVVIQPLLSRLIPVLEPDTRPDGTVYRRVAGWRDEYAEDDEEDVERTFSGFRLFVDRDVRMETSEGILRLSLRADQAPNTVWNFRQLVDQGFYDGLTFHRIVPLTAGGDPFVVQGGDPSGTGDGGPGYWLPLEPSELEHDFGVVGMARGEYADSAGSQFYIALSRSGTARLDGQYTTFAEVVEGWETILALADVPLDDPRRGLPVNPPTIKRAWLIPAPPRFPGEGRPDRRVEPEVEDEDLFPGRVPR